MDKFDSDLYELKYNERIQLFQQLKEELKACNECVYMSLNKYMKLERVVKSLFNNQKFISEFEEIKDEFKEYIDTFDTLVWDNENQFHPSHIIDPEIYEITSDIYDYKSYADTYSIWADDIRS